MDLAWMAWTWPTALFFVFIGACIGSMAVWERFRPGGDPRRGVFAIETTRGDRLFLTLVGSAFIFLGWLGVFGTPLWWPVAIAVLWAGFVFRFV